MIVQIYVPMSATTANTIPARDFYSIGLAGRYKARLQTIVWADSVATTSNRLIRMRSDCFKNAYGTFARDILFCNQSAHTLGNPQGEWCFTIEANSGQIDLEFTSSVAYDGTANNIFQFAIITMDVEKIED